MALIPKEGTPYIYKKAQYPEAYGRVIEINMNRIRKIAVIVLEIYPSAEDKSVTGQEGILLEQHHFTVALAEYDQWMEVTKLKSQDPFAIAYQFIMQYRGETPDGEKEELPKFKDWTSDELIKK
jgi:hypothetical protein